MFTAVRKTRSSRATKERQTRRVQRGGNFSYLAVGAPGQPPVIDPNDQAIWTAGIDAAGLGTAPLDLKILFINTDPALTDLQPAGQAVRINTYFKLLGEQDKVARIPIIHVQKDFLRGLLAGRSGPAVTPITDGTNNYTAAGQIDALPGDQLHKLTIKYAERIKNDYGNLMPLLNRLVQQFDAVINMGAVGAPPPAGRAGTVFSGLPNAEATPTNKLENMFMSDQIDIYLAGAAPRPVLYYKIIKEFEGAMINPQRIENVLLQEITKLLKYYKNNLPKLKADLDTIRTPPNPFPPIANVAAADEKVTNFLIIVDKMTRSIFSNVMLRTNKLVEDGWQHGDKPVWVEETPPQPARRQDYYHVYTIENFFHDFYETMKQSYAAPPNFAVLPLNHAEDQDAIRGVNVPAYGTLAAKILIAAINNRTVEDLFPAGAPPPFFPPLGANPPGLPQQLYHAAPYKGASTFQTLCSWVDPEFAVQFVKHLEYQLSQP